jgi:uncharacterized protein
MTRISTSQTLEPAPFLVNNPEIKSRIVAEALTSEKLELILLPTEQCNFRCTYCYEDFAIGKMRPAVVTGVKALVNARVASLAHLHFSWFGGEPLAAYDVVKDISQSAKTVCDEAGVRFTGEMTTNGYTLSQARVIELASLNMKKYQISLDGAEEDHNKTRLRADGSGTFARIWENIRGYQAVQQSGDVEGAHAMLRLHLHPNNLPRFTELLDRIESELDPKYFSIYLKNITHLGGPNDDKIEIFKSRAAFADIVHGFYKRLAPFMGKGDPNFVYVCYAGKANSFLIRADGRVGKCTVALADTANTIGEILETGELQLDGGKLSPWLHALGSMDINDLRCPVNHLPRAAN